MPNSKYCCICGPKSSTDMKLCRICAWWFRRQFNRVPSGVERVDFKIRINAA